MDNFNLKKYLNSNPLLTEGQFSWFTQDTNQQIGSEDENTLPFVYMHDNKGNKWLEKRYEGYGVFGGKDYYELLDQMNGGSGDRSEGIRLAFDDAAVTAGKVLFPALTVSSTLSRFHDFTEESPNDPNQSWYTPEDGDDDYITGDRDDEYLDESKIEEGLTPLQQHVYDFESEVSGEDFAEEEKENIMNLKTVSDVKKYYADYRGWMDDSSLREMLMDLLMDLSSKFPNLKEDSNKIEEEKPKTKMKKSELKEMIRKAMMEDTGTAVTDKMYDPVTEAEGDEEVDVEADAEATDTGAEETMDVETTTEIDPNVKAVQDALTSAIEAAKTLGDKKLEDQIGNTITFFTRTHVVGKNQVAEDLSMYRMLRIAGIKSNK